MDGLFDAAVDGAGKLGHGGFLGRLVLILCLGGVLAMVAYDRFCLRITVGGGALLQKGSHHSLIHSSSSSSSSVVLAIGICCAGCGGVSGLFILPAGGRRVLVNPNDDKLACLLFVCVVVGIIWC